MLPPNIKDNADKLIVFLETIGVNKENIKDRETMCIAFVHKSYAADYNGDFTFNERLEFLWDSILGALVAKILYEQFPDQAESDLTLYKIALVRAENLALVAQEIWLDKIIFLGNGEEKNNGRQKTTILCDCLEALLWYIYLDIGIDTVEKIVQKYIVTKLDWHTDHSVKSYKSHVQELIQKAQKLTPHYKDTEIWKDELSHEILYKSEIYVWEDLLWVGTGTNKKKAQEQAAKDAYEKLISYIP